MDQPFAHTLSFDDLEVLVLVENGGATPREVADSLGMDLEESKALFFDLLRRGLLTCQEESTTFQLTPMSSDIEN
jgi:DNA-binding IclR family transcriptional regulator